MESWVLELIGLFDLSGLADAWGFDLAAQNESVKGAGDAAPATGGQFPGQLKSVEGANAGDASAR